MTKTNKGRPMSYIYVFGGEKGLCGMKRKMDGDRTNETKKNRRAPGIRH